MYSAFQFSRSFNINNLNARVCLPGFAGMSKEVITGLNISKGGSDPPLKADEEYPEWLWQLAQPERTLGDLRRADGSTLGFDEVNRTSHCRLCSASFFL